MAWNGITPIWKLPCFQSALLLTDSQSTLAPGLKSFWDIWKLSDSISSRVTLSFQWVPSHSGLFGNELADSLSKIRAALSFSHVPSPLALTIAKIRHTATLLRDEIFLTTPSSARTLWFPQRNWSLPVSPAVNCPDFPATSVL